MKLCPICNYTYTNNRTHCPVCGSSPEKKNAETKRDMAVPVGCDKQNQNLYATVRVTRIMVH